MSKLFVFFLLCFVINAKAQSYTIPWAQQQPSWVFPLWFEDALGNKDTLYIAYDDSADQLFNEIRDSVFGDYYGVVLDTSIFQAYFGCSLDADLIVGNSITTSDYLHYDFCFWKCQLPLIIRWDKNLFYSDSLPYNNQSPAPRAQGLMFFDLPMWSSPDCYYGQPILVTDSINPQGMVWACVREDSIKFENQFGANITSYVSFQIVSWTGTYGSVKNIEETESRLNIFPNPVNEKIKVALSPNNENFEFYISDLFGRKIMRGNGRNEENINIESLSNGCYILSIIEMGNNKSFHLKIFKQ